MIRLIHVFLEILRTMFFTLVTIIAKKAACKHECFFFLLAPNHELLYIQVQRVIKKKKINWYMEIVAKNHFKISYFEF